MRCKRTGEEVAVKFIERGEKVRVGYLFVLDPLFVPMNDELLYIDR